MDDADLVTIPLYDTLSFWVTVIGAALAVSHRTRRAGAVLLMAVGYGGVGVAWERTCGCDLRRLHRPPRLAVTGLSTHLPLAIIGHVLWQLSKP